MGYENMSDEELVKELLTCLNVLDCAPIEPLFATTRREYTVKMHDIRGELRRREKQRPNSRKHPAEEAMSEEYEPKTPLGEKLWAIRQRIVESGQELLTLEEIDDQLQDSRGGVDSSLYTGNTNYLHPTPKPKKRKAWVVMLGDVVKWALIACFLFWPLALGIYLACTSDYNPAPEGSEAHAFGPAFSWSGAGFLWQLGWATLVIVAYIWLPRWRKSAAKRAKGEG